MPDGRHAGTICGMAITHAQLAAALAEEPFVPFILEVEDGRRIEVKSRDSVVLNSFAISVVEAPFSVTVIGIPQITAIATVN